MSPTSQPDPGQLEVPNRAAAKSSAVKAGWICLILGFLTFWIFGFGFIFFIATFVLAIVAMCSNRVSQGIALLISSVGSGVICAIISLALLTNVFTAALKKERAKRRQESATSAQVQQATTTHTSLHDLFGPAKRSLVVNINTASAKELESLPGVGSSHADAIIANRPYSSVDDLSRVKGMTPRVIEHLRSFVKTDGATEKREH
ncbi:MAG TPA: helix-hairpin-helix domain-containing protein [Candidatus Babeliales bacterium]|jgi:competence ComEA-like helix-hairpin-helix protein|nr:helix-hairpin-helix domain-containing protein [Candidatus Babeliales bacterium]